MNPIVKSVIKYGIIFGIGWYIGGCDRQVAVERRYELVPKAQMKERISQTPSVLENTIQQYDLRVEG